jgi:hypothetical protein
MEATAEISRLSMQDIYNYYNDYGIPNFQRGLVWDSTAEALLLESIYYKTPCGILLFWKPREEEKEFGIPLEGSDFKQFIVDGQQRIHIMHSIFSELENEMKLETTLGMSREINTRHYNLWCINVSRWENITKKNAGRNLFIRKESYNYKDPSSNSLIPLNVLYQFGKSECKYKGEIKQIYRRYEKFLEELSKIVLEMTTAKIFIEEFISGIPSKIIDDYTRINTSGKKVEPYEKAFASLVKCYPETNKYIKQIFSIVYPGSRSRSYLERKRENLFGFQVFIKIFGLLFNYHAKWPYYITKSLYAAFDKQSTQEIIQKNPEKIEIIWKEVKRTVRYFGGKNEGILRKDLFFDDLRFLPQGFIDKLTPLFLMVGMYHTESNKKAVTYLTVRVLLFGYKNDVGIVELLNSLARTSKYNEAYDILNEKIYDLEYEPKFREKLEHIGTVQNQYINTLYALTRYQNAEDFIEPEYQGVVCKKTEPQKQHIIPRSKLTYIYDIIRRKAHNNEKLNNIGNITYISAKQNIKLGDKCFKYDSEPVMNLKRHSLLDENIKKAFNILKDLKIDDNKDILKEKYEELLKIRREIICKIYIKWVKSLKPDESEIRTPEVLREEPCLWTHDLKEMKKLLEEVKRIFVQLNPKMNINPGKSKTYFQIIINEEVHFEMSIERLVPKSEERFIQIHLDLESPIAIEIYDERLNERINNLNGQIPFEITKEGKKQIWYVVDLRSYDPDKLVETLTTFINLLMPIFGNN